ncbi:MAG: penicillin-binding transpeptidase domain-containing protein [Gammaproteobacteria bacterium]|nr:penicillin-binding transpeptidase domain-containing protein [Gammaproteobacteria bacterium]MCY4342035.1 penicillin-binding transpeptidase domain-containing protein [Gammaproteobacteria bacterium]
MKVWRHHAVLCLFLAGCAALAARVVYLALLDKDFLQDQGDARSVREVVIPSRRGVIYDRLDEPLAISTPVVAVWSDPSQRRLSRAEIDRLGPLLGRDAEQLEDHLNRHADKAFVYLKRRLSWTAAERVRALRIEGLHFSEEYRRYYIGAETAAHVVGVTNIDDRGLEGVELAFDDLLSGEHGRKVVLKDRLGATIRDLEYIAAPRLGQDIALSIDLRLQYFAYRELKDAVAGHQAASGSIVILDARTGEILALVNSPSYNPNESLELGFAGMRNRAVTDSYEPGSTIKPFAVLAALETGEYQPDTVVDTAPGYWAVRRKLIEDPVNYGELTLAGIVRKSSQVGISKVALDLPERAVFEVLQRAGIGDYIGSGLPGEAIGTFDDSGLRSEVVRATLAYGYGLSVSPLQLAQAYLPIANDGVRLPLSVIKLRQPPQGERVFAASMTRQLLSMMEGVTERTGTAPGAQLAGYRVAGKTGTARLVSDGGYTDQRHVALFAGVVPLTAPRIVMVVVINQPGGPQISGGAVAAPIFARVAERALRLLGVAPDAQHLIAAVDGTGPSGGRVP